MSAAEMVKETFYVKPGDDIPNIGISPQFEEGIAPLENAKDVGEKTPIQNGFAIPMLVDKKEPRDAEFDEVKDQIVEVVKLEKARHRSRRSQSDRIGLLPNARRTRLRLRPLKGLTAKEQKDLSSVRRSAKARPPGRARHSKTRSTL